MAHINKIKNKKLLDSINEVREENGLKKLKKINRDCLRCEKEFITMESYNRICPKCTNEIKNQQHSDIGEYDVGKI